MSNIELPANRLNALSDWMNPILVKETRQALKSRQFVGTFMLLLISCWLICMFGIIVQGAQIEFGSPSTGFFQCFFIVLSVAVILIVPFSSFRSLLSEQDSQTYELLSITSLSPRQIVWGKLLNAVVQVLVYYCAISPFIAFTSLLQGFDLFRTLILMTSLLGFSILLSMFTLMLSTVAKQQQYQALATLFIFGGLITVISSVIGYSYAVMGGAVDLTADFFWGLAICWVIGISYFILFHQITVSQLMFEAGNKSTGVRLIATGQFLLLWGIVAVNYFLYGSISNGMFGTMLFLSMIHWAVFGFFISMERDHLSRRIRRDLPQSFLYRLLLVPFMPGGTRGYLLLVMNIAVLNIIVLVISPMVSSGGSSNGILSLLAIFAYVLIYFGIGCAGGRWLLSTSQQLRPAHTRSLLVVMFAMGIAIPYMILFAMGHYDIYRDGYHLLHISNPFVTIPEINSARRSSDTALPLLMIALGFVVLVNIPAMLKSAREIVHPKRPEPATATEVH